MIEAVLFMMGLGLACSTLLSAASKIFYVYEDPRIAEVEGFLAGANCGGCGFPGCSAAAGAIVSGNAAPSACVVGGMESAINVARIMGLDPGTAEPKKSLNECNGGDRAEDKFLYNGIASCRAISAFYGGKRICSVGCL